MKKYIGYSIFFGLASASGVASATSVRCVALVSWGCTDEGVCVDSARARGAKFTFDRSSKSYHDKGGLGKIISEAKDDRGHDVLNLSDGRRFVLNDHVIHNDDVTPDQTLSLLYSGKFDHVDFICQ